jgi:hypothetical protein
MTPNQPEKPKLITICGSTKFKDSFIEVNKLLTLNGYMVLTVGFFLHSTDEKITNEQKQALDELHKMKILISDAVVVINNNNYIGDSTRSEIYFAYNNRKPIILTNGDDNSCIENLKHLHSRNCVKSCFDCELSYFSDYNFIECEKKIDIVTDTQLPVKINATIKASNCDLFQEYFI